RVAGPVLVAEGGVDSGAMGYVQDSPRRASHDPLTRRYETRCIIKVAVRMARAAGGRHAHHPGTNRAERARPFGGARGSATRGHVRRRLPGPRACRRAT